MKPYAGLASEYDALTNDVDYHAYLRFYQAQFQHTRTEICSVLDLGCGTGTLTLLMDGAGYDMIGVDAEPEMLNEAMEKVIAAGRGDKILLLNQSMEELDLYGTVDAAVSSLDCFNYIPPEDLDEVFRRLRLFIRPGGLLIFDVLTEESLKALDGQIFCDEQDGVFCVWRGYYDEEKNCCRYLLDDFSENPDGTYSRFSEEHVEYSYSLDALRERMEKHGFRNPAVISGSDAVGDTRRVFYVVTREDAWEKL